MSSDYRLPPNQQLRDHLVDKIIKGRWRRGEAIHTEVELAAELYFPVGTVRNADTLIVGEGMLDEQQGRGTLYSPVEVRVVIKSNYHV